jgi:hypothetical protein
MLRFFKNKARYDRGQLFPYLIAILVAVLTVAMITVNLGQLGIFRTDTSNAADAGALAAASTLSSYLLGIGFQSDQMCGVMLVEGVVIILAICSVSGIPAGVAAYIALTIKQYVTYFKAMEDGKMAWSNAKKAALQYAFQNVGVDEPRPTFKSFLDKVYGISDPNSLSAGQIKYYNSIYALGDDPSASESTRRNIKKYSQTGFSRFMEGSWYWNDGKWGEIKPGNIAPAIVTNGYGWNANGLNSFDSGSDDWDSFENSVKVQVMGNIMYPLSMYNPVEELWDNIKDWIEEKIKLPWWLEWLDDAMTFLIWPVAGLLSELLPGGLMMGDGSTADLVNNTDNNHITVTVDREKHDNNLGLWRFRYGTVKSQASAHTYRDTGDNDIKPMLFEDLADYVGELFSGGGWSYEWFKTEKHLFETELVTAR